MKAFYIKTEGLTEDQLDEVMIKSVKQGATYYEGFHGLVVDDMVAEVELTSSNWKFVGVADDFMTTVADDEVEYGECARLITFAELDDHLRLTTISHKEIVAKGMLPEDVQLSIKELNLAIEITSEKISVFTPNRVEPYVMHTVEEFRSFAEAWRKVVSFEG